MDSLMWYKLWPWAKIRHGMKSRKWIRKRYFHTIGNRKWCFATNKDGKIDEVLRLYAGTKIKRHVKVQAGRSYYDGDEMYWARRLSKGYGNITPSKARMLKFQDGKCVYCNAAFKPGDKMESHQKIHVTDGGSNRYRNLVLLHRHCHDQYHAEYLRVRREECRNNKGVGKP
jgi:RNA-directed DNA polymerase